MTTTICDLSRLREKAVHYGRARTEAMILEPEILNGLLDVAVAARGFLDAYVDDYQAIPYTVQARLEEALSIFTFGVSGG